MTTKKILITGANSYIGTSFEKWVAQWPEKYVVDTVDMIDGSWREKSFSGYDVVFHVAGIAHSDVGHVTEEERQKYYDVNTTLPIAVAEKAKTDGVRQFIFMSSSIVYGESAPIGKSKVITKNTPVAPANFYGDTKVQAENRINALKDTTFKVVILRPPMIYGKNSKGNYRVLAKLAQKLPVFPKVNNARSMLYIGNLTEFVSLIIDNEESGIFWPANKEYSNTSELVQLIAAAHGKRITLVGGCEWALLIMSRVSELVNKAFGNFTYDQSISEYKQEYRKYSLIESIKSTEKQL